MARTRNIKPAFFKNESLAELDPIERLVFIGLWTLADYKGCLEYRPKRIKAEILPYDNFDIDPTLTRLSPDHIQTYVVNGVKYIKIVNFEKHQNPHKKERDAGSEIPDMTQDSIIIQEDIKRPDLDPTQNGTSRALNLKPLTSNLKPLTKDYTQEYVKILNKPLLKISEKREKAIIKFAKNYSLEDFKQGLLKVKESYFLMNSKFCGFDWIIKEDNFIKIMEGNYANDTRNNSQYGGKGNNTGKLSVTDAVRAVDEAIARGEI